MLSIVGIGNDNQKQRIVLAGIYRVHETYGIPLEVIVNVLERENLSMSVPHFISEAVSAGMTPHRAFQKLRAVMIDSVPKNVLDEYQSRLEND